MTRIGAESFDLVDEWLLRCEKGSRDLRSDQSLIVLRGLIEEQIATARCDTSMAKEASKVASAPARSCKISVRRLDIADRTANRWEYRVGGQARGRAKTEAPAYARASENVQKINEAVDQGN